MSFTYNKYSLYRDKNGELNFENKNGTLLVNPLNQYKCGNINEKLDIKQIKNDLTNKRIKVLDNPMTSEKFYNIMYKYPITPLNLKEYALEQWEKKQPLIYNKCVNLENQQYPISLLENNILNNFERNNIYDPIFFTQKKQI